MIPLGTCHLRGLINYWDFTCLIFVFFVMLVFINRGRPRFIVSVEFNANPNRLIIKILAVHNFDRFHSYVVLRLFRLKQFLHK